MERIVNDSKVMTSLRRCHLGLSNLNGLIMIYKNWPIDARSACKLASTNVVEFSNNEHEILDNHENELEEARYLRIKVHGDCCLMISSLVYYDVHHNLPSKAIICEPSYYSHDHAVPF